ncbi:MAG: hypothetical protein Q4D14_06455 [Bacteroidales bacterium]|nr:hypothetical protein [Bacteroidales bacterium]
MIKGIITGDLVNSSNIATEYRQMVIDSLNAVTIDFSPMTSVRIEIFRGDSFQVVVDAAQQAPAVAVALRAKLKASTPDKQDAWDARVSVGIGEVSYESDTIVTSDGEAFRLSGRAFDVLGKKRLAIASPSEELNESVDLNTRFADDIITALTVKQARVVYHSLLFPGKTQKDMAEDLGMSRQNFNYIWLSAKGQLILDYTEHVKSQILKYIAQ